MSMMISPVVKSVQRISRTGVGTITINPVNPDKTVIIPAGIFSTGGENNTRWSDRWELTNPTTVTYANSVGVVVGVMAATVVEFY